MSPARVKGREGFTLTEITTVIGILCILATIAIYSYSSPKKRAYDLVAQEDLRQAYFSAITYFMEHPSGVLTHSVLAQYGFKPSPKVSLSIIDGRLPNLLLISRYNSPGTQAYITHSSDVNSSGASPASGQPWLIPVQEWKLDNRQTGARPFFLPEDPDRTQPSENTALFLEKCNLVAKIKLGEAYAAAQAFFQSNPNDLLSWEKLIAFGYTPYDHVNLTIVDGSFSAFSLTAAFEAPGAKSFILGPSGHVAPGP